MLRLNNGEKTFCDRPFCEDDILKSIKNLHSGKTPGSNGFTSWILQILLVWYQTFIYPIYYIRESGELCGIMACFHVISMGHDDVRDAPLWHNNG